MAKIILREDDPLRYLVYFGNFGALNEGVTGVTTSEMVVYGVVHGSSPSLTDITSFCTLTELSAANMPGWYHLSINTTEPATGTGWDAGNEVTVLIKNITSPLEWRNPEALEVTVAPQNLQAIDALISSRSTLTAAQVWDEAMSGHQTVGSAGRTLTAAGRIINDTTVTGIPTSTTIRLTAGSTTDDFYNHRAFWVLSGTGIAQAKTVHDYTGATRTITVDEAFIVTPASGDQVILFAEDVHSLTAIENQVWNALKANHTVADSFGDYLDDEITSRAIAGDAMALTAAAIDAIWDELKSGHTVPDSFGDYLDDEVSSRASPGDQMTLQDDAITAAKVAVGAFDSDAFTAAFYTAVEDEIWNALKAGHTVADSFGDYLDDEVSSRSAPGDQMTLADDAITAAKVAVGAFDSDAFTAAYYTAVENEIWDALKSGHTVADSFGDYLDDEISSRAAPGDSMGLSAAAIDAIWDELKAGHTVPDSFGDYLDDEVSSRAAPGDAMDLIADAVDATALAASALAEIADAVWDELKAGHTIPDSFGDYLDDEVSSRAAPGDAMDLVADAVDASALAASALAEIADAVWDELYAGHTVPGSFGELIQDIGTGMGSSAQDVWEFDIDSITGASQAGNQLATARALTAKIHRMIRNLAKQAGLPQE